MTCVVGIATRKRIYMGADSAGVAGYDRSVQLAPKVFRNGQYLIGYTSSFRMGQLLEFAKLPEPPATIEWKRIRKFMVTEFVDAIRGLFKKAGYLTKKDEVEAGGTFLIGVNGRLFKIQNDLAVLERADGFDAVGCGDIIALGAMYVSRRAARARVMAALQAAEEYSIAVTGPFRILSMRSEVKR